VGALGKRQVPVNITLGPHAAASTEALVGKLKKAGLHDVAVLDAIGLVTGRIADDKLDTLKRVPGVTVEVDESISIGPPDAPLK
jgi:hypothetical protein